MMNYTRKKLKKFQGNWIQIAYERNGIIEPIDDEEGWMPRTIFIGNEFVVKISDGTIPIKGIFKIDPSQEPKHIEYTDTYGQYTGETYSGIYYLNDDILVFCVADHLAERPKVFKTGCGHVMRTFKRELDSAEYPSN